MAEEKKVAIEVDGKGRPGLRQEKVAFPSNSHKSREERVEEEIKSRKVNKVVTGKVTTQKKGAAKRFSQWFFGDETKSVMEFIMQDILANALRTMICDMFGWGGAIEMAVWGDKQGRRNRRDGGRSYTSYGSYYKSSDREKDRDRDRREMSRVGRARHDFDEIVLESRGEAEEVLSHLVDLVYDYGQASVADLYDLTGIATSHVDYKFGWTDLGRASVSRVRDGYLINLPRTVAID